MAIRVRKLVKELYDVPAPSTGDLLRWKSDGNLENVAPADLVTKAVNQTYTCSAQTSAGDLVTLVGPTEVRPANIAAATPEPAIGCVVSKPSATTCEVKLSGPVTGIYSDLVPGKRYFVGVNARPSALPVAAASGTRVFLQAIGVAEKADTLVLMPSADIVRVTIA